MNQHSRQQGYARLDTLPMPFATDLLPMGVEPHDWWSCRYCDAGECNLGLTTEAEATRALAHQAFCPARPHNDRPDQRELDAFRKLFGDDCLREIDLTIELAKRARLKLTMTWWPATRRQIKRELKQVMERQRKAADRLCVVSAGYDPRSFSLAPNGTINAVSEQATEQAPIYRVLPHDVTPDGTTQRYMIVCDEGWRTSIVCEGMYHWAAEWLVNTLGRRPYAPNRH